MLLPCLRFLQIFIFFLSSSSWDLWQIRGPYMLLWRFEIYICWLVTCSFPRKYKKPMQLYKMIQPARLVQKCFSTSILVQGSPAAHLCTKLKSRWFDHFVHCIGFLYFRGKLHVTSQQIYILSISKEMLDVMIAKMMILSINFLKTWHCIYRSFI